MFKHARERTRSVRAAAPIQADSGVVNSAEREVQAAPADPLDFIDGKGDLPSMMRA